MQRVALFGEAIVVIKRGRLAVNGWSSPFLLPKETMNVKSINNIGDNKMDDMTDDPIVNYIVLGFIITVVGWLLYTHTGVGDGKIEPVYWAGVATPLLSQIAKKAFNLTSAIKK